MKRIALVAMALLLALALTGCAQNETDLNERIVVRAGSAVYTYGDLLEAEASSRAYYEQMNMFYAMYGLAPMEMTDAQIREEALNNLAVQAIVLDRGHSLGLTTLTDDELREISNRTTAAMAEYRANIEASLALPEDMPEAERTAAIDAAMAEAGITREAVYSAEWENYIIEKTRAWAVADVTVTEEDFQAAFAQQVASEQASMAEDPFSYGLMVLNGQSPLYAPAGYRQVDWFYISSTEGDMAKIDAIQETLTTAETEVATCEEAARTLLGEEADIDALVAQVTVTLNEVTDPASITVLETVAAIEPALNDEAMAAVIALANARALRDAYQQQLTLAIDAANAAIAPEVTEALNELANGTEWAQVQAQYNDDVSMYYGSPIVCEGFPYAGSAFVNAAMALTTPGEWTAEGVYEDGYGCFIIRYDSDVTEGTVDPATVRETMMADLLSSKQEESFSATLDSWIEAASRTLFINYDIIGQ